MRRGSPQLQGGSLETRPSPEISPRAMRTRPFKRLVGGHDATTDPLYNEQGMDGSNQVAQNTPDLAKRQGTTNPVAGGTKQGNKLVSGPGGGVSQDGNAMRPRGAQKTAGRSLFPKGRSLSMKKKLRTAFGGGGMAMPMQSGNRRSPGSGAPMGNKASGYRGPRGAQGQRAFNANPTWPKNSKGGTKATPSNTSIRPNQSAKRNV